MKCFDCATHGRAETAVAVCTDCGAAMCLTHADVEPRWLTCTGAINRTIVVEPPGRAIRCHVCQSARSAVAETPARSPVGRAGSWPS